MNKKRIEVLDPSHAVALIYDKVHKEVIVARDNAVYSLLVFCKKLKDMKDSKLYLSAGYKSFNDYAEDAVGLKKTAIYDYLQLSERSEAFMKRHSSLGVSKLNLFAKMTEEEASSYIEAHDVENTSYRELKQDIKSLNESKQEEAIIEEEDYIEEPVVEDKIESLIDFIQVKRNKLGLTIRELARKLSVDCSNLSKYLRYDKNILLSLSFFTKLIDALNLNDEEVRTMYKLHDMDMIKKKRLSEELAEYISKDETVLKAIIAAKDNKVSAETWNQILKLIEG